MPQLTFLQKMSDKASRLIPSAFSEIVDDTTSEVLTSPDYENIMFICDQTNQRPDNAKDVVLAVRRRIDHANPKVQYFTVLLLDALIKNCYEELHNEIAETPALQNCLVEIAVRTPIRDGELEAKKAALQLILNMSYWFIGAASDQTKMLSKLADEVRAQTSPLAFEDIEADASYQLKRRPANRRRNPPTDPSFPAGGGGGGAPAGGNRNSQPFNADVIAQQQLAYERIQRQHRSAGSRGGSAHPYMHQPAGPRIVDAIPVYQYTEAEIAGMLDSCMLLSEMINTAEEEKRSVVGDDIVTSIAVQIRRDHKKLAMLLDSGARLDNVDVLASVAESQSAIIQRLSGAVERDGKNLRDVAGIGAEEESAATFALQQQNRAVPPQQVTRANPMTNDNNNNNDNGAEVGPSAHYGGNTVTLGRNRSTRPRQGDIDDGVEMGSSQTQNQTIYSPSESSSTPLPLPQQQQSVRRTAESNGNNNSKEQELDAFFGGGNTYTNNNNNNTDNNNTTTTTASAAQQQEGDHNIAVVVAAPSSSSSAPPPAAPSSAPNTDFFESNNSPSSGVNAEQMGSINGTCSSAAAASSGGDEFDAFLNSRLQK